MRDLDTLLTSEMTPEEWTEFRCNWIKEYAEDIVTECGGSRSDAGQVASIRFEDYVGQEGYTMRDMLIGDARDG